MDPRKDVCSVAVCYQLTRHQSGTVCERLYTVIPRLTKIIPYVMWPAHFFVTHIQTEKISSWNGPTVHVCCFMLARAST